MMTSRTIRLIDTSSGIERNAMQTRYPGPPGSQDAQQRRGGTGIAGQPISRLMLSHPREQRSDWHTARATQYNTNKPQFRSLGILERRLHTRHRARTTVYITL